MHAKERRDNGRFGALAFNDSGFRLYLHGVSKCAHSILAIARWLVIIMICCLKGEIIDFFSLSTLTLP